MATKQDAPPAAVRLRAKVRGARSLLSAAPVTVRMVTQPILDEFEAYILETELRIARLECVAIRRGEGG